MNSKETTVTTLIVLAAIGVLAVYCIFFAPKSTDKQEVTEYEYESTVVSESHSEQDEKKEFGSLKELSQKAGFTVKPLKPKGTAVTTSKFILYGNGIAEIIYTCDTRNKLTYRQSKGSGDNTGSAPVYHDFKKLRTLLLKGSNCKYGVAVWEKDGFTYSITSEELLDEGELIKLTGENLDSDKK